MILSDQMENQGHWLFKYRGVLPLVIFSIGLYIYFLNQSNEELWVVENTSYETLFETFCLLISVLGLFIRVYTVGYTPDNTSGRNTERQVADVLNTKGIYSIVRNPLYLGNYFMWLGIAALTGSFWFTVAFTLLYILYYERIIFTEEKFLISKFGTLYTDWAQQTPVIIPRFAQFKPNENRFSWKKVLRQEKNGLAALFLIFLVFDVLGELIKRESDYNYPLLVAAVLSVLIYVILKFLKYQTKLLRD